MVGVARRPRRLYGARHPRPGDLCRPGRRDGHCPIRVAPAGRQREPRPAVAAGVPRDRGPVDGPQSSPIVFLGRWKIGRLTWYGWGLMRWPRAAEEGE